MPGLRDGPRVCVVLGCNVSTSSRSPIRYALTGSGKGGGLTVSALGKHAQDTLSLGRVVLNIWNCQVWGRLANPLPRAGRITELGRHVGRGRRRYGRVDQCRGVGITL
jgi:hypothetical protein